MEINIFIVPRKMIIIMRGEPSLMHDISEIYYNIDVAKETKVASH